MFSRIWTVVGANRKVIVLTFEIFWIVVFLLNRIGGTAAGGVPAFVYVNF